MVLHACLAWFALAQQAPVGPPPLTKEQVEARSLAHQAVKAFEDGAFERSAATAQRARALDAGYELPVRVMGWCAVATGDDAKAAALLTEALNLSPRDGELQYLLAGCHLRLEEWGAAKDLLSDLIEKSGATTRVLLDLASCCAGEEDFAGARAALEQARKLAPADPVVVERIVALHERLEEWDEAAKELRALSAAAPSDASLRRRLAQVLLTSGRFAEAATELEETARGFPEDPAPHRILEQLYASEVPDGDRRKFHQDWLKEWNLRRR